MTVSKKKTAFEEFVSSLFDEGFACVKADMLGNPRPATPLSDYLDTIKYDHWEVLEDFRYYSSAQEPWHGWNTFKKGQKLRLDEWFVGELPKDKIRYLGKFTIKEKK